MSLNGIIQFKDFFSEDSGVGALLAPVADGEGSVVYAHPTTCGERLKTGGGRPEGGRWRGPNAGR